MTIQVDPSSERYSPHSKVMHTYSPLKRYLSPNWVSYYTKKAQLFLDQQSGKTYKFVTPNYQEKKNLLGKNMGWTNF